MNSRRAKTIAKNIIFGNDMEESNDEMEQELEIDDVANDGSDEVDEDDIDVDLVLNMENSDDEVLDEANLVDMESDDSESEDEIQGENNANFISANGLQWTNLPPAVGRRDASNIIHNVRPGFRTGIHPNSNVEAFNVIMDNILDLVVHYTNISGRRKGKVSGLTWKKTTRKEIDAFIGIHILGGAYKASHRSAEELWNEEDGIPYFKAAMSYKRFRQLKSAVRFDDALRRDRVDKLSPIRSVIELFNNSLREIYTPGPYITVDEQLIEYHGRVGFRRHIPSKPGKYGMLLYWSVDVETTVPLFCLPYIGEQTFGERCNIGENIPTKITYYVTEPFLDKGRNITTDNYFTSMALLKLLKSRKTTLVGTLRQNKREIPPVAKSIANRNKGDTKNFYTEGAMITSFWDKKKKPVILLSSMHNSVRDGPTKNEVVEFYNRTKGGVDNFDKVIRGYRSQRKCFRWPYGVFFTLCDAAVYTAYKMRGALDSHYEFKKQLGKDLCWPLINKRSQLATLQRPIKEIMIRIGVKFETKKETNISTNQKRGRCYYCKREKDTKVRVNCDVCGKFVCTQHRITVSNIKCQNCV